MSSGLDTKMDEWDWTIGFAVNRYFELKVNSGNLLDICRNDWRIFVFRMLKPVNCCVHGCLNKFRNISAPHYYRISKESRFRKQYVHLIRNKTLKIDRYNSRFCSDNFDGDRNSSRQQLPLIFPWPNIGETSKKIASQNVFFLITFFLCLRLNWGISIQGYFLHLRMNKQRMGYFILRKFNPICWYVFSPCNWLR